METRQILIKILTQLQTKGIDAAKQSMRGLQQEAQKVRVQAGTGSEEKIAAQIDSLRAKMAKEAVALTKTQIADRKRLLALSRSLAKSLQDEAKAAQSAARAQSQSVQKNWQKELQAQLRRATQPDVQGAAQERVLERQARAAQNTTNAYKRLGNVLRTTATRFSNVRRALRNVTQAFSGLGKFVNQARHGFGLFNNIFARVSLGMLTWQAWRSVVAGFRAMIDAVVAGNAKMQTAIGTFTALSGGSQEMAITFIDVLKQLSVQTGAAFDELLDGARRLPSRVGQNVKAFEDLTKAAIVLSRIDPIQGLSGAFFALTNAMEGTAQGVRSLVQRFEIGTTREFRRAIEETGNVVDAITLLLQRSGIEVDSFLKATENTLPVVAQGINAVWREFLRLGSERVINAITDDLVDLRNWLRDNQAAVQGLAQAIGGVLSHAFAGLKAFIKEIVLGGREVTAANIFDVLLESAVSFIEFLNRALIQILTFLTHIAEAFVSVLNGLFSLFGIQSTGTKAIDEVAESTHRAAWSANIFARSTEKAADAVKDLTDAAKALDEEGLRISADQAIAKLSELRDVGKETLKAMVTDILDAVTGADLEAIGTAILQNIINLEAQEIAQEKSIKNIENWVDQAEREVRDARDRLKLFDLATADIPERYTRARRRALETEILRAEQERERRKEALDAAKAQLAVTREQLSLQRQILSLIQSRQEEVGGVGIDTAFQPGTIDTEAFKQQVAEFRDLFDDRLQPAVARLRESFGKLGEVFRGLFGADSTGQFTELYELGVRLRDALSELLGMGDKFGAFFSGIAGAAEAAWNFLPPGLRNLILFLFGVSMLPLVRNIIPLTFKLLFTTAGTIISSGPLLKALLFGAATPVGALTIAVGLLVGITWLGREELVKWITGERQMQLFVIITAQIDKVLNNFFEFLGFDTKIDLTTPVAESVEEAQGVIENAGFGGYLTRALVGLPMLAAASLTPVYDEFVNWATSIKDELVTNSIFPDMIDGIIALLDGMPARMANPLRLMREAILNEMTMIRTRWIVDWTIMANVAENALRFERLARQEALNLSATLSGVGLHRAFNRFLENQGNQNLTLNLDANETRQLMEDGVYTAILGLP